MRNPFTPRGARIAAAVVALVIAVIAGIALTRGDQAAESAKGDGKGDGKAATSRPALSVVITTPRADQWPQLITANGNITAWQEAVIGPEISGSRLTEVLVNVGDYVKKGQLLARIAPETVAAELAQTRAAVAEAEATLAEARANADRARQIQASGALSTQQINQYQTAAQTALARLNAAKARVQADELRLAHARVVAPDDGVISARTATVGSLAQQGQELFRLVRGGRLEWRAEVTATDLARVRPGMAATLTSPAGALIQGRVRTIAPTVDPQTRTAIVYVDLPPSALAAGARAGMFARGQFELTASGALTLPQTAVLLRDGFNYVYRVEPDNRVTQVKVEVGRRIGERVEIIEGVTPEMRVVESGVGFLADGDIVRVVDAPAQQKTAQK